MPGNSRIVRHPSTDLVEMLQYSGIVWVRKKSISLGDWIDQLLPGREN